MLHDVDPALLFPHHDPRTSGPLKGKYSLTWVENTTGFEDADAAIQPGPSHIGNSFSKTRAQLLYLSIFAIFFIIIGRLVYLQGIRGSDYFALAESNRQRVIPVPAPRGLIFDTKSTPLTQNIPNFSLALIPQDLPKETTEFNRVIERVAGMVNVPTTTIGETIAAFDKYKRDSIIIAEDIPYETALLLQIESPELPGVYVQQGSKRLYDIEPTSLAHILGYVGKLSPEEIDVLYPQGYSPADTVGKTGIEKSYEKALRGVFGRKRIEVNATGQTKTVLAEEASYPGAHLQLHIDDAMQEELERIMGRHLKAHSKTRAAGVVMDPENGAIRALVSLPSFNNNDFSGGINAAVYRAYTEDERNPLFHRAIAGTYPSGSTIKPALAAAGLEEGVITDTTSISSVGGIRIGRWFFPDWLPEGHGATDVRKSLAWSVNTFYYYLGGGYGDVAGLGVSRMVEYLKKFGLSSRLGIDTPGEADGFLPTPEWKEETKSEQWYIGDTYNMSIGQGDVLVTPLQMAALTSVIANGGTLYKPHVVQSLINPLTKERKDIAAEPIRSGFIDPAHVRTVQLGMRDCVLYGSCRQLSVLPIAVAGKTGTAQWSKNKDTHAWFTSFAPFEKPEIVVTILVEEGGEGARVAAPIAKEFYAWWARYRLKS